MNRRAAPEVWVLVICTKEVETAKAILLNGEDDEGEPKQAWVPKSQIAKYITTENQLSGVVMKQWIADDKEFAYTICDKNGDAVKEDGSPQELTGRINWDRRDDDDAPF